MTICQGKCKKSILWQDNSSIGRFLGLPKGDTSEKIKLNTYGDVVKDLWNTFKKLASNHSKIAFLTYIYHTLSKKSNETDKIIQNE